MSNIEITDDEIVDKQDYLAALDIGSNSFHFVMARQVGEHLQIVHAEKYRVQLAQGLDSDNVLNSEAIERGVSTLEHLAATTQHIHPDNFRVVATFTLRQARNAAKFLKAAALVFPFRIEIISGHEEARLIYQGVAHHSQSELTQLVIDIGGGSTECIIGKKYHIKGLDSLNMGCVSYQQRFFKNNEITHDAFKKAIQSAKHEVEAIAKRFKKLGWEHVIGTSGTIKAITKIVNDQNEIFRPITLKDLYTLKAQLIGFGHVDNIDIVDLKETRRTVLSPGVAILIAVMESLEIDNLEFCKYALREGVLFEHLENLQHNNVRKRTVESFIQRFNSDINHVNNVNDLAMTIFDQVKTNWQLNEAIYQELLTSAIRLHEIGMDINASGYHRHGQYILEHADLAGFNQEQQKALAWLVGNQRKKITTLEEEFWYLLSPDKLQKLAIIIRLSVLLNQQRHTDNTFLQHVSAQQNSLTLTLDHQWLLERPIIDTELLYEQSALEKLSCELLLESV